MMAPRTKPGDRRPAVAIGHVWLEVRDVAAAVRHFLLHGMRLILEDDAFAVLELRGGTHLVLSRTDDPVPAGTEAPFDLMVDDLDAARRACAANGMHPSRIARTRVHRSFRIAGPDGYRITITSSHAGRWPV
jgi:hypothetical protein